MATQGPSPLEIQELVDHIISFVPASSDLVACSLVARGWVDAARAALFFAPHVTQPSLIKFNPNSKAQRRLYATFNSNPRSAAYVRELSLQLMNHLDIETPHKVMTGIHFPCLKWLSVALIQNVPESIQLLMSRPTLRHLSFADPWSDFTSFAPVWDRCASTIEHLSLNLNGVGAPKARVPRIHLKSLRLAVWNQGAGCPTSLAPAVFNPFNISHLKALAIVDGVSIPWQTMALDTIQIFEIDTQPKTHTICDLSLFLRLNILRIIVHGRFPTSMFQSLRTIICSQPIHTIFIAFTGEGIIEEGDIRADRTELDEILSCLTLSPLRKSRSHIVGTRNLCLTCFRVWFRSIWSVQLCVFPLFLVYYLFEISAPAYSFSIAAAYLAPGSP
ncbi:hypothetical protein R3P38DRAFT_2662145 [Favolaschia claudopus]|uniref:F-box domain-containing protein n=1 Tax=Favolaschia claudopus TaxID=2862362 RepID=A0AAV9ZK31_9AGAR